MASIFSTPNELLAIVTSNLFLPDFGNFARSRKKFSDFCRERIHEHLELQSFAFKLSPPDPRYGAAENIYNSDHCDSVRRASWKDLLIAVVEEPQLAYYINHLSTYQRMEWQEERTPSTMTRGQGRMIRAAIEQSKWTLLDDVHVQRLWAKLSKDEDSDLIKLSEREEPGLGQVLL